MSTLEFSFSIIVSSFVLLGVLIHYWLLRTNRRLSKLGTYRRAFPESWRAVLEKFNYYQELGDRRKKRFERRVMKFIMNKKFVPRNMDEVTDEMKVMIAASGVQLTFGLSEIYFSRFRKIHVFPGSFYSKEVGAELLGEVNAKGIISLSWKDFLKGYEIAGDARNVGLHEMAHVLKLENRIRNKQFGFLNPFALSRLNKFSRREIAKIRSGQQHFLRKYAGANSEEFFAVSVEYFFEQPRQMRQEIPELYDIMSKLLRQDPAKKRIIKEEMLSLSTYH